MESIQILKDLLKICAISVIWFASITKYSPWLTHVQRRVTVEGTSSTNLVLIIAFCMAFDSKVTRSLEMRMNSQASWIISGVTNYLPMLVTAWRVLNLELWYGKTRVTSYDLRVESLKAWVKIQKCAFKFTSYEFKSRSYEFKTTSYEFKTTSYEFMSTSSRIIKSMKTQVNYLQIYTRNLKITSDFIKFTSQRNFKHIFV